MITTPPTTALLQARKQGKAMAIRRRDAIPFEICFFQKKELIAIGQRIQKGFSNTKMENYYLHLSSLRKTNNRLRTLIEFIFSNNYSTTVVYFELIPLTYIVCKFNNDTLSLFCTIPVLYYLYVKRVVLRRDILVLLDINVNYLFDEMFYTD